MRKILSIITFLLVSIMAYGCATSAKDGVNVSGQVSYEYKKSL